MNKEVLKSQPIIDWLMYPQCKRVIWSDRKEGREFIDVLKTLRGKFKKPVYVTLSFLNCAVRAYSSFAPLVREIIEDNSGEMGIVTFSYFCNKETKTCVIWGIVGNRLCIILFSSGVGYDMSNLIFSAYRDCDKGEYRTRVCNYTGDISNDEIRTIADMAFDAVFLYIAMRKYAKVEVRDLKHGKKVVHNGTEYTSTSNVPFEIFDSKWFTEICSDKDFSVRGHFRLQPKKVNGEWTKELIYINEFMKHGYHRKALIDKVKEEQNE